MNSDKIIYKLFLSAAATYMILNNNNFFAFVFLAMVFFY